MKKVLSILLAAVMLVCMASFADFQVESDAHGNTFGLPVDDLSVSITCGFYGYSNHNGFDLGVSSGTALYSMFSGTATFYQRYVKSTMKSASYGNYVVVTSDDGTYQAYYCHLSSFNGYNLDSSITSCQNYPSSWSSSTCGEKRIGSKHVSTGELLGYSGSTGNSTGPHCHIGLKVNGSFVDPDNYISFSYSAHDQSDHTRDTNYGTEFTATAKEKIYVWNESHTTLDNHWIDAGDVCTIHEVYTDGCCYVSYPTSSGTQTYYAKISSFSWETFDPQASGTYVYDLGNGEFRPCIEMESLSGVTNVRVAVWATGDRSDLQWYDCTNNGSNIMYHDVPYSNHNSNATIYFCDFYAYGANNQSEYIGGCTFTPVSFNPKAIGSYVYDLGNGEFRPCIEMESLSGVTNVRVAVWATGDQSDLQWYDCTNNGSNTMYHDVPYSNHNSNATIYFCDFYAYGANNQSEYIGGCTFTPAEFNPQANRAYAYDLKNGEFRPCIEMESMSGVANIRVAVWSDGSQSDVKWYDCSNNGANTMFCDVPFSNYTSGARLFHCHFYAYSYTDQGKFVESISFARDLDSPNISNVKTTADMNGYTVSCSISDDVGVTRVRFPSWTEKNGQDDLIWHEGTINGNTATCYIKKSDHNNEIGKYITDIYAYDDFGHETYVSTSCYVEKYHSFKINVNVDGTQYNNGLSEYTFDVYIDGKIEQNDVKEYNDNHPQESSFEIKDIKCPAGYAFTEGMTSGTITSATTVTLNFSKENYTVTLNANGGSCSTSSKSVTYDSAYGDLPTPTRENYKFEGWYTEETGGTIVTSETIVTATEDHTLYAHWSRFGVKEGSTAVIEGNYIYGLKTNLTAANLRNTYLDSEGVEVTFTKAIEEARYYGTGSTVTVKYPDGTEEVYTIIIFGDIDGNAIIDNDDAFATLSAAADNSLFDAVQKKAANVDGVRRISVDDYAIINDAVLGIAEINQAAI